LQAKMASAAFEDFLTCAICLETFKDPVSLSCHHSFCYNCITNCWEQRETKTCPVCKRRSSKENLWVNFALNELCISFRKEQKATTQGEDEVVCLEHPDEKPLFCKDEGHAFCAICELNEHENHTWETVEVLKEQIEVKLKCLKDKREEVIEEGKVYEEIKQHSERQEEDCERHVVALFDRLQRFLANEKEKALSQVREEQQRRDRIVGPELERVRGQLSSLSQRIQALERQLQRGTGAFLTHYSHTQKHAKIPQAPRQVRTTAHVDVIKYFMCVSF
uniref:RING-type domain-containing protein n=1 Tax=Neogobius melanostomus TaxID=47308 RepID=A0A8C6SUH5_9GOBI